MTDMRAKLKINKIDRQFEGIETLHFNAVGPKGSYPKDGSDENNSYARWTPTAELRMVITNPNLHNKFSVGEEYYVDFTKANGDKL